VTSQRGSDFEPDGVLRVIEQPPSRGIGHRQPRFVNQDDQGVA
jgi:hypothetical protein